MSGYSQYTNSSGIVRNTCGSHRATIRDVAKLADIGMDEKRASDMPNGAATDITMPCCGVGKRKILPGLLHRNMTLA